MRIAFVFLTSLLAATPLAASPLEVLPSGHPVVEVSLDGSAPRRFVIDTAASRTTILPSLRAQMPGLVAEKAERPLNGASGATEIEMGRVDRLTTDGKDFRSVQTILLPPSPVDGLGVDGILGADIIADFAVELDAPGRRWRMASTADAEMTAGMATSLPFVLDDQRAPRLTIKVNGVDTPALLDTGARGTILNWAAAKAIGLSADTPGVVVASQVQGSSTHGTASVKTRLDRVELGAAVVAAPQVRIADLPIFQVIGFKPDEPAVILGLDLFAGRRLVIDHPGGRLLISEPVAVGTGTGEAK